MLWEIEDTKVIDNVADLTNIYIGAAMLGVFVIILSVFIMMHYRSERQLNEQAMQDREKGVATWGVRMPKQ